MTPPAHRRPQVPDPSARPRAAEPTDSPDPWEARLVAAIRNAQRPGEAREALAELLTAYQDRMFAVCFRMVRDPEIARDLTQDTLVKVIQGFDSFDARARLSTWMTRIAMNVCLSHLRKQRLRRHASLESPGPAGGGDRETGIGNGLPQRREPGAANRVEGGEAREYLLRAMEQIDPEHRAVLTLRDLQGLDYQEVAEALEVPVGTVKSRLFRARAALREAVERLGWPGTQEQDREVDR